MPHHPIDLESAMLFSLALLIPLLTIQEAPTPALFKPASVHTMESGFAAQVRGSVFSSKGSAIEGARISVYQAGHGWSGGQWLLGTVFSGEDGSFAIDDIAYASGDTFVQIVGGPLDLALTLPVALATGSAVEMGAVQLQTSCALEGTITNAEDHQGGYRYVKLLRQGTGAWVAQTTIAEGGFRLTDFPPGDFELEVHLGKHIYRHDIAVKEGAPRTRVRIKLLPLDETFALLPLEDASPVTDQKERPKPTILSGHLHDPDGKALAGFQIIAHAQNSRLIQTDPGCRTQTAEDGSFQLKIEEFLPARLWIMGPHGSVMVNFKETRYRGYGPKALVADPTKPMNLVLHPNCKALPELTDSPASKTPVPVQYSVFSRMRWRQVSARAAGTRLGLNERRLLLEVPGHLPRVISLGDEDEIEDTLFQLQTERLRGIRVHCNGAVVPGARIYLKQRQLITGRGYVGDSIVGEFPLDESGTLKGLAPSYLLFSAIIVAPNHTPRRVHIYRDGIVDVNLTPADRVVRIEGLGSDEVAFLCPSGSVRPVWTWRNSSAADVSVGLGNGSYDLLVTDYSGTPQAGQSFEVLKGNDPLVLHAHTDTRSTLTLRLPEPPPLSDSDKEWIARNGQVAPDLSRWTASATRGASAGGTSGAMAMSSASMGTSAKLPTAAVEQIDSRTLKLTFQGTGNYWINVGDAYGVLDNGLLHEVLVPPQSSQELTLPPLKASFSGGMRAFNADTGFSHHGFAGPRLWIGSPAVAGRRTGWSVKCYFPGRIKEGEPQFITHGIPAGEYWVQDHLSESGSWGRKTKTHAGALIVEFTEGQNTTIKDFADYDEHDLEVIVRHSDGRPFTEGSLTTPDPMSDAWQAFTRIPTTGVYADAHIPIPKRFRLNGSGMAIMSTMKYGAVLLKLEADAGWEMTMSTAKLELHKDKWTLAWILPNVLPE